MSIVLVGSTSGSCTLQEQAVAGNTVLTLPTTSGTLITTGSSGQSIPKAALPTGSVLQVVNASSTSVVTITTSTYTDTGLTATITPTSASSKIIVLVNQECYVQRASNFQGAGLKILRNGTDVYTPITDGTGPYDMYISATGATLVELATKYNVNYVDSPASTSALTYKTQARPYYTTSSGQLYVQGTATMILMEIAA